MPRLERRLHLGRDVVRWRPSRSTAHERGGEHDDPSDEQPQNQEAEQAMPVPEAEGHPWLGDTPRAEWTDVERSPADGRRPAVTSAKAGVEGDDRDDDPDRDDG
jgi:hypothetical protein